MWTKIAQFAVPRFPYGYTIGECYADEFKKRYGVQYKVVRNATVLKPFDIPAKTQKFILYQGAVNVGRCFEQLIPAMQHVEAQLIVCGEGNFYKEARELTTKYGLDNKIQFKGYVPPNELTEYTAQAWIGITLFEETSLSNRLSLANRFFDYMHYCVPQLCIQYPEYEKINARFEIASLIAHPTEESIAAALNRLLGDDAYYHRLQQNCKVAREKYCWQQETITLLNFYKELGSA
jgi:glycosyltransferase involved in cell wall biosynthesis